MMKKETSFKGIELDTVYKYCEREHALIAVQDGIFRITTLEKCRDTKSRGSELGDKREGEKSVTWINPQFDTNRPDTVPTPLKEYNGFKLAAGEHDWSDARIIQKIKHKNCWIFCVSSVFNTDSQRRFGRDSCLKIVSPFKFITAMSKAMGKINKIEAAFFGKCNYRNRDQTAESDDNTPPSLIKDPRFKYQNEWRVVWIPESENIEEIDLTCLDARKYCTILD